MKKIFLFTCIYLAGFIISAPQNTAYAFSHTSKFHLQSRIDQKGLGGFEEEVETGASRTPVAVAQKELDEAQFNTFLQDEGFDAAYLFLGHGSKGQFKSLEEMERGIDEVVTEFDRKHGKGNWVLVFGGDPANAEKPDLGYLVLRLKEKYPEVALLAVQADEYKQYGVGDHVDYVFYYPPQKDASDSILYGGLDQSSGELLGSSRFYLSDAFIQSGIKGIVSFGGGAIAKDEVSYGAEKGLEVIAYKIVPRFIPETGETFGVLDAWLDAQEDLVNVYRRNIPTSSTNLAFYSAA